MFILMPAIRSVDPETRETVAANRLPWRRTIRGRGTKLSTPIVNMNWIYDEPSRVHHQHSSGTSAVSKMLRLLTITLHSFSKRNTEESFRVCWLGAHHPQRGRLMDISLQYRGYHVLTSAPIRGVMYPEYLPVVLHVSPCLENSPAASGYAEAQNDSSSIS